MYVKLLFNPYDGCWYICLLKDDCERWWRDAFFEGNCHSDWKREVEKMVRLAHSCFISMRDKNESLKFWLYLSLDEETQDELDELMLRLGHQIDRIHHHYLFSLPAEFGKQKDRFK